MCVCLCSFIILVVCVFMYSFMLHLLIRVLHSSFIWDDLSGRAWRIAGESFQADRAKAQHSSLGRRSCNKVGALIIRIGFL